MERKIISSKEHITDFIALYKSLPCLWKVKSKDYCDRNKKSSAYEVLVNKLQEQDPEANRDTAVKKINSLRSSFRKELKKVVKSKVSGAGEEDIYTPNLWYFDLLEFLTDQEIPHQSTSTLENTEEEIMSHQSNKESDLLVTQSTEPEDSSRPSTSASDYHPNVKVRQTIKVKRKKAEDPTDTLIAKACEKLENVREDQFDTVGKTIASKLRSLPNEQRIFAEKLINDVLFEAELGSLTRNSKLVAPAPAPVSNLPFVPPHEGSSYSPTSWYPNNHSADTASVYFAQYVPNDNQ